MFNIVPQNTGVTAPQNDYFFGVGKVRTQSSEAQPFETTECLTQYATKTMIIIISNNLRIVRKVIKE
jgi:hypothetical protein